ncbi:MAG: hypothetical protein Q9167_000445 [Letrouitia subvulpina]
MPSSVRQPFGVLGSTRLRGLTNTKNYQNAIQSTSSATKRSAPSDFDHNDNENKDPGISLGKKAKNVPGEDVKSAKPTLFPLVIAGSNVTVGTHAPTVQKVKASKASTAPAGRSPQKKRAGILSRHRMSSNPFKRNAPSFKLDGLRSTESHPIDTTLSSSNGGLSKSTGKELIDVPLLEECMPKNWMFKIYEESEIDQAANVMNFTTNHLDISDDEGSRAAKNDRGKENVPPSDVVYSAAPAASAQPESRKDMMTEEVRSPLGDLNPKDFYAADCDETSVIIVPSEDIIEPRAVDITEKFELPMSTPVNFEFGSINAKLAEDAKPEIDIWESESAKDEAEGQAVKDADLIA